MAADLHYTTDSFFFRQLLSSFAERNSTKTGHMLGSECHLKCMSEIWGIRSPTSLKVVEKPNKCKKFLVPKFFGATTSTVLRQIVSAIYCPPFGTVWLSSVCWSPSATPGNEEKRKIFGRWVKVAVQFEAVCGPKFMSF